MEKLAITLCLSGACLLTACGGSDNTAPVPPGPPVTQSIDATGGKIVLTASGIKTTLDIPAGALSAATSITVTPVAPVADESARMSVTPSGLRFAHPATVTFELPAGRTPNKAAAVVPRLNGRSLFRASTVDAAARTVSAQIDVLGQFTRSSAASARAVARVHALAASAPDTPPDGTLSLAIAQTFPRMQLRSIRESSNSFLRFREEESLPESEDVLFRMPLEEADQSIVAQSRVAALQNKPAQGI